MNEQQRDTDFNAGFNAGRAWARASNPDLVEKLADNHMLGECYDPDPEDFDPDARVPTAPMLDYALCAVGGRVEKASAAFWEQVAGTAHPSYWFLRGFYEGVVDVHVQARATTEAK